MPLKTENQDHHLGLVSVSKTAKMKLPSSQYLSTPATAGNKSLHIEPLPVLLLWLDPDETHGDKSSVVLVHELTSGTEGRSGWTGAEYGEGPDQRGQDTSVCRRCWKLAHHMEEAWIPA